MLKIVHISDTHGKEKNINLPKGDVIVHSGDFSYYKNSIENLDKFLEWLSETNFKYKILVSGNHDSLVQLMGYEAFYKECKALGITYLEDTSVVIKGIKFYGSPWVPIINSDCFQRRDYNLIDLWDNIDTNTNVLITHTPAYNVLDKVYHESNKGKSVGSRTLSNRILELSQKYNKLKLHLHGHIHEDYGKEINTNICTMNSSIVNYYSKELNIPLVFEYI